MLIIKIKLNIENKAVIFVYPIIKQSILFYDIQLETQTLSMLTRLKFSAVLSLGDMCIADAVTPPSMECIFLVIFPLGE